MDELIKALNAVWESGNFDNESDEYSEAMGIANEVLITTHGHCNFPNLNKLREYGYYAFAGDKDSFGWLTGVIRKKGDHEESHCIVYG